MRSSRDEKQKRAAAGTRTAGAGGAPRDRDWANASGQKPRVGALGEASSSYDPTRHPRHALLEPRVVRPVPGTAQREAGAA